MNPVYKFSVNGHVVNPLYKQDISKEYTMEPGQQFFRTTLSGNLRFLGVDFEWLSAQNIEIAFNLYVEISYDGGASSVPYWQGIFYKTDGKWDFDNKIVEVKVHPKDQYTEILANMENEYNLLDLSPGKEHVLIDKRPILQVYLPGRSTIDNFMGGTTWKQNTIVSPTDHEAIQRDFIFANPVNYYTSEVTNASIDSTEVTGTPTICVGSYMQDTEFTDLGDYTKHISIDGVKIIDSQNDATYRVTWEEKIKFDYDFNKEIIIRAEANVYRGDELFFTNEITIQEIENVPFITVYATGGMTPTTGSLRVYRPVQTKVYQRIITDKFVSDELTHNIPNEDIVADNRNYRYASRFGNPSVLVSTRASIAPTKHGKRPDGLYYAQPVTPIGAPAETKMFPIASSEWGYGSIWFYYDPIWTFMDQDNRKEYVMKDAISLSSAISAVLRKVDPELSYANDVLHSIQLSGEDSMFITPKSNITAGAYTLAARKAPVKLKMLLDLLMNIFQCYWFVEDGRLRIEHISWFKNGGSYSPNFQEISYDLTSMLNTRNDKSWAFLSNKFEYDKNEMPERFEFSWMDEVSEAFSGFPIEMRSKYIQRGKIDSVNVSNFTT